MTVRSIYQSGSAFNAAPGMNHTVKALSEKGERLAHDDVSHLRQYFPEPSDLSTQ
jgi:hypothetical protein